MHILCAIVAILLLHDLHLLASNVYEHIQHQLTGTGAAAYSFYFDSLFWLFPTLIVWGVYDAITGPSIGLFHSHLTRLFAVMLCCLDMCECTHTIVLFFSLASQLWF